MEKQFFWEKLKSLKAIYGQDVYPKEVVRALYSELKHVNKHRFERAINRVIANNPNPRFAPGLDQIEIELGKIIDEDHSEKINQNRGLGMKKIKGIDSKKASRALSSILKTTEWGDL